MEKTVPPTLFAPSPLPIDPTSVKPATAVLERSVQSVAPTQHTWLAGNLDTNLDPLHEPRPDHTEEYFLAVRYHTSITSGHRGSWRWRARPHYGWRYSVLGLDRGCFLFYFFSEFLFDSTWLAIGIVCRGQTMDCCLFTDGIDIEYHSFCMNLYILWQF